MTAKQLERFGFYKEKREHYYSPSLGIELYFKGKFTEEEFVDAIFNIGKSKGFIEGKLHIQDEIRKLIGIVTP